MNAKQGRLFDEPEDQPTEWQAPPNARASGPETSKEAGRKVERSGRAAEQRRMVLACLENHSGSTYAELARYEAQREFRADNIMINSAACMLRAERLGKTFHKRLPELKAAKLARVGDKRKCAVNGTTKQAWFATEENR